MLHKRLGFDVKFRYYETFIGIVNAMPRKALLGTVTDSDLRLLRVFRAVVACGGFAAAERPDQRKSLSSLDGEIELVQDGLVGASGIREANVLELQLRQIGEGFGL